MCKYFAVAFFNLSLFIFKAMSCSLVPIYLNEISPAGLRGQIGVIPQLHITFGILIGQLFGFYQILGKLKLKYSYYK